MNESKNLRQLLINKSKLSSKKIDQLVSDKIKSIGRNYLTLQGSIFLVAYDLKIKLSEDLK